MARTYFPSAHTLWLTLAAWATLNMTWPMDWPIDPRALALASLVPQTLTVVLVLRRRLPLT